MVKKNYDILKKTSFWEKEVNRKKIKKSSKNLGKKAGKGWAKAGKWIGNNINPDVWSGNYGVPDTGFSMPGIDWQSGMSNPFGPAPRTHHHKKHHHRHKGKHSGKSITIHLD